MDHKNSYSLLFSHAEVVADLLQGFVKEDWVKEVDISTLERFSGSHVSDALQDRHDDLIWRVRWKEAWLYVYLLLEFQSSVDEYMALRILAYVSLLYQELVRGKHLPQSRKLPPVFPLVLYNGSRSWTAAQEVAELIETLPAGLTAYRPRLRYLLLDINRFSETQLAPLGKNLAAAVFRLENSRTPQQMRQVISALAEWLRAPDQLSLRRALTEWIRRVLMPARLPGVELGQVNDLVEVESMLAERVMEWTEQWKQEGRQEGRQEGLAAERALLLHLARKHFGESCVQALAPLLEPIADQERLTEIGEWIMDCTNGEDLLFRVRQLD